MEQKVKVEVVMLSTEKASMLWATRQNKSLTMWGANGSDQLGSRQHLYFVSERKPTIGDWVLEGNGMYPFQIVQVTKDDLDRCLLNHHEGSAKVIEASTDADLGLLRINERFLRSYVTAFNIPNPITHVLLESHTVLDEPFADGERSICLKTVISKRSDNTVIIHPYVEPTYSHTDLKKIAYLAFIAGSANPQLKASELNSFFDEWFDRNFPKK